jgi:DNA polymerase-4
MDFLHPLPVGALWGVGPKTEEVLLRLGLRTVGDLAHVPARTLQRALGAAAGTHLHELSWGRDPRRVVPDEPEKSTGHEVTFGTDVDDPVVIHRELLRLSERTAGRLRSGGWLARTVSIKIRFADFATITRSRTLDVPTDVAQELYDTARSLFDALGLDRARIRLVGVRAERLVDAGSAPQQLELGARERGRREAELAADRAARRFGAGAVRPATLLHRDRRPGGNGPTSAGPLSRTARNRGGGPAVGHPEE